MTIPRQSVARPFCRKAGLLMRSYSLDEIRRCFATSTDFNEIFDVFQSALAQNLKDVEPYRLLFWNHSLTPDEVRLFGEKLAGMFPELAYDIFIWLASIFEVTYSSNDNYELALHYYRKAAAARPNEADPYLDACDCYDPDLNIPPLASLIEFVRQGVEHVPNPAALYRRLARLYELAGDAGQSDAYRRKADDSAADAASPPPAE
jgi:tetratricopeptide (TPR) repeat protein